MFEFDYYNSFYDYEENMITLSILYIHFFIHSTQIHNYAK